MAAPGQFPMALDRKQIWWCVSGAPGSGGHTRKVSGGGQEPGGVSVVPIPPKGVGAGHAPDTYAGPPASDGEEPGPSGLPDTGGYGPAVPPPQELAL